MNITLTGNPSGTLRTPDSKSWLHRALICAALSDGKTFIRCTRFGEDVQATLDGLRTLGAGIELTPDGICVCGGLTAKKAIIDCGQSGTTLRFLLPVTAACGIRAEFVCDPQLRNRPMLPLIAALEQNGCRITKTVTGYTCEGQLQAGKFTLPGDVSSQFVSGLLLALPLLCGDSEIVLSGRLQSAPYVRLTEAVQAQFGIRTNAYCIPGGQHCQSPKTLAAEGDWSNAAPFLCMGAFSEDGITVAGLDARSAQGDRVIIDFLTRFGAEVRCEETAVTVRRGQLRGIGIDASDTPDLVPLLALLGTQAEGRTQITGADRLRTKESDRLETTANTLNALGASVTVQPDGLFICGGTQLNGGTVSSCGDHRIAMLAAAAAVVCTDPVALTGAEAVNKSYPDFFTDFSKICR